MINLPKDKKSKVSEKLAMSNKLKVSVFNSGRKD